MNAAIWDLRFGAVREARMSTSNLPPESRRLLVVASEEKLRQLAMDNGARELLAGSALTNFWRFLTRTAGKKELMPPLEFFLDGVPSARASPEEAQRAFRFDVAHYPEDGTVYVQHPCFTDYYLQPADFHARVAKEKVAAFKQLAAALGAKKLTLTAATSLEKGGLFNASVPLPKVAAQIGLNVGFTEKGSVEHQVYAEFDEPIEAPAVPEDLRPWLAMDPEFRTMARTRTEQRLRVDKLSLEVRESAGMHAKLAAKLMGKGLDLGGEYTRLSHTVWKYDVEYWTWNGRSKSNDG